MEFKIRPYHPSDLCALYRICLQTCNSGEDVSHLYPDPDLIGHMYAGPYGVYEPDLCFILTSDGAPCGYIIGTRDSQAFSQRCERDWFPILRERYPLPRPEELSPSAGMIRAIHQGYFRSPEAEGYPAHLHIDLLQVARGQGLGRKLMETFLGRLRELKVPAVHLGVGKNNQRAILFYERLGFHPIKVFDWGILFGMYLY